MKTPQKSMPIHQYVNKRSQGGRGFVVAMPERKKSKEVKVKGQKTNQSCRLHKKQETQYQSHAQKEHWTYGPEKTLKNTQPEHVWLNRLEIEQAI